MKTVLLLGGSELLWWYLGYLRDVGGVNTIVLSSKRHLDADLEGIGALRDALATADAPCQELKSLSAETLSELGVDLSATMAISIHAPWIIKQDVIDLLGGRIYNLHGTRLPQDRGGASVSWQIMRGHKYGFALMHRIDAGIDTGEIMDSHEFLYKGCITPLQHQVRYAAEVKKLLERVTPRLLAGEDPSPLGQPPYLATYWPRLNTEVHGWIDWSWSGDEILRFVCAFDDPYAGAHTMLGDRVVYLKDCCFDTNDGAFHPFQAGLIYRITSQYAAVSVTTGSLLVGRLSDAEGRPVLLDDLRLGDRLFTPVERLEAAKRTRVQYTALGLRGPKP